jgi:hypothetical protein
VPLVTIIISFTLFNVFAVFISCCYQVNVVHAFLLFHLLKYFVLKYCNCISSVAEEFIQLCDMSYRSVQELTMIRLKHSHSRRRSTMYSTLLARVWPWSQAGKRENLKVGIKYLWRFIHPRACRMLTGGKASWTKRNLQVFFSISLWFPCVFYCVLSSATRSLSVDL